MRLSYFVFVFLLVPCFAMANIEITEVMYDVEGTDSGREWIEIFNDSTTDINIEDWKIYENETNHKINLVEENDSFLIPAGGYFVIADNPSKFLIDYPQFSGAIFDSAFSLKNTGEELIIRNSDLNDIDSILYNVEIGANGDGNSLQKISGEWVTAIPTPGGTNSNANPDSSQADNDDEESNNFGWPEYVPPELLPQIKAYGGKDKIVIVGALSEFNGEAFGLEDGPLEDARYLWNFGDGVLKEGKNINHFYRYPGEYRVVLSVSSGGFSSSDSLLVKAIPGEIFISEIKTGLESFVELENKSKTEINISGWIFSQGSQSFIFPKDSFIRPKSFLVVPAYSSGFSAYQGQGAIELLYPGGFLADSFNYSGVLSGGQSFSRSADFSVITQETPGTSNEIGITTKTKNPAQKIDKPVTSTQAVPTGRREVQSSPSPSSSTTTPKLEANIIATVGNNSNGNKINFYIFLTASLVVVSALGVFFIRRQRKV